MYGDENYQWSTLNLQIDSYLGEMDNHVITVLVLDQQSEATTQQHLALFTKKLSGLNVVLNLGS